MPIGPLPGPPPGGERRDRQMGWRSRDVLRAVALTIALLLTLRMAWEVSSVLLTVFLGVLFGLALGGAVDALARWRVPRGLSAAGVVLLFYGALVGIGFWIAPTLRAQGVELRRRLPEAVQRVEGWLAAQGSGLVDLVGGADATPPPTPTSTQTAPPTTAQPPAPAVMPRPTAFGIDRLGNAPTDSTARVAARAAVAAQTAAEEEPRSLRDALGAELGSVGRYVGPLVRRAATVLGGLLLVTFVAIYLAVEPRTYREGVLLLVPQPQRARAREVLEATATTLRRWLLTQLVGMVVIGVVTTGVLLALGVEAALALGVVAGLLEFVPFVGPIVSAVPAIAMGFLDSPEKALSVTVAYVVIQQLESNVLMPLLMREGLELPPILTLLAQGAMALLFGFLGVVVAVPLLAAVMVPIKMLYVRDVVGEAVSIPGQPDGDAGSEDATPDG